MGRIIPYIMENKKCLKPPTRIYMFPHFWNGANPKLSVTWSLPETKDVSHFHVGGFKAIPSRPAVWEERVWVKSFYNK
jgi:hypothetical protein